MRGETPHVPPPWHETNQPGVFLDTRLLGWRERVGRQLRIAALCLEAVITRTGDDSDYYPGLRDINQRYLDNNPATGAPNPPYSK